MPEDETDLDMLARQILAVPIPADAELSSWARERCRALDWEVGL
jgi:hypothetical protein